MVPTVLTQKERALLSRTLPGIVSLIEILRTPGLGVTAAYPATAVRFGRRVIAEKRADEHWTRRLAALRREHRALVQFAASLRREHGIAVNVVRLENAPTLRLPNVLAATPPELSDLLTVNEPLRPETTRYVASLIRALATDYTRLATSMAQKRVLVTRYEKEIGLARELLTSICNEHDVEGLPDEIING